MTADQIQGYIFSGAFLLAFVLGLRASWRLRKRYVGARPKIDERNRLVLLAIVLAAWVVTVAAGWFGGLSAIRLLTGLTFPWTPPITLLLATAVVFVPVMLDTAISLVADAEEKAKGVNQLVKIILRFKKDPEGTNADGSPLLPSVRPSIEVQEEEDPKDNGAT